MKVGKSVKARLWGALTDNSWNLDISLFILLLYFLSLSPLYFCLHSLPVGKRGLVLVMRTMRQGSVCVGAVRSSNKSVSSLLPLESLEALFHLRPTCGLAEDLCIWVTLVVGGDLGEWGHSVFLSSWVSHPIRESSL